MVFINTCLSCQLIHILGNLARGRGNLANGIGGVHGHKERGHFSRHLQVISKPTPSRMMTQQRIPTGLCSTPPPFLDLPSPGDQAQTWTKIEKAAESSANLEKGN